MQSSLLESYLKDHLPELENLRVSHLAEITDGWETEIYSFDVESGSRGEQNIEKLVLRMYAGPWAVHKARKEYSLLRRLHNAGYPVPMVSLIEEESSHLGRPFIIMERIEGDAMWNLISAEENLQDSHLYRIFSRLFHDLHNLDWRQLAENPQEFKGLDSKKAVANWIEKYKSRAKEIGKPELLKIVGWLEREIDGIAFSKLSPTHNDFHPNNILIDGDSNPFVIDWTAADIMDYRVDLAWTILLAKVYAGESMYDAIIAGYEEVSQKPVEDIHFFEVVGALRRLTDILVSLEIDSENIGLRDGAAEMIREQLPQNMTLLDIVKKYTGLELPGIRKLMSGERT
ncbi:MAG: phosphotransferase family protein [Candidatus Thorarchaeota archaeon]|jgi:aminoglycoside phosphotransferase (APT) family kinase protein